MSLRVFLLRTLPLCSTRASVAKLKSDLVALNIVVEKYNTNRIVRLPFIAAKHHSFINWVSLFNLGISLTLESSLLFLLFIF